MRLGRIPVPGAAEAEERAWAVVRAAYEERERIPARRSRRRIVLAVAAGLAVAAAALSPPGLAVLGSVRHALAPGAATRPRAELSSLPAPGRLLVDAPSGAWIVKADGSKRRLGPYRDATWSPHGLYVTAARGHDLFVLDPTGNVRWTVTRPQAVRLPSWNGPDGYRIAFLAGTQLRVVDGDGTHDRLLAARAAAVRPAWLPGPDHAVAYVAADGAVTLAAADTGARRWSRPSPEQPAQLAWSSDGTRLVVVSPHLLRVLDRAGRELLRERPPAGSRAVAAAFRPGTRALAELRRNGAQTTVSLVHGGRVLFNGPGEIDRLAWSPDGHWLLVGWRTADQWLFLRPGGGRATAVANVSDAFGSNSFPALAGWCCGG